MQKAIRISGDLDLRYGSEWLDKLQGVRQDDGRKAMWKWQTGGYLKSTDDMLLKVFNQIDVEQKGYISEEDLLNLADEMKVDITP